MISIKKNGYSNTLMFMEILRSYALRQYHWFVIRTFKH